MRDDRQIAFFLDEEGQERKHKKTRSEGPRSMTSVDRAANKPYDWTRQL